MINVLSMIYLFTNFKGNNIIKIEKKQWLHNLILFDI